MTVNPAMRLEKVPMEAKGHMEESGADNSPVPMNFLKKDMNPDQGKYPEKLSGMDNANRMNVERPSMMEGSGRERGVNPKGEVHKMGSVVSDDHSFESRPKMDSYQDAEEYPSKPRSAPKNLPPHENPHTH